MTTTKKTPSEKATGKKTVAKTATKTIIEETVRMQETEPEKEDTTTAEADNEAVETAGNGEQDTKVPENDNKEITNTGKTEIKESRVRPSEPAQFECDLGDVLPTDLGGGDIYEILQHKNLHFRSKSGRRICIKTVGGNIGNIMWRSICGKYYADTHDMDLLLITRNRRDWRWWLAAGPKILPGQLCLPFIPKGLACLEWRQEMANSAYCYTMIPECPEGKNLWIGGVAEDYHYFEREYALDMFRPQEGLTDEIRRLYGDVDFDRTVSINVRRGEDKLKLDWAFVIPTREWLERCIEMYGEDQRFIVTSDGLDWCKQVLGKYGSRVTFADRKSDRFEKQLIDMYIQTLCKDNIISNSTFSWWGAYMNEREGRKVYHSHPWYKQHPWAAPYPDENWITV